MKARIFQSLFLVAISLWAAVSAQQETSSTEIGRGQCGSQLYYYYTITCAITGARNDMRLQVSIVRQISRYPCVYGQSYGVAADNLYMWTSRGCEAEFSISSLVSLTQTTTASTTPATTSTTTRTTTSTTPATTSTTTRATTSTTPLTTSTTPLRTTVANSAICGQAGGDSGFRIIGGTEAENCEFPWMVLIYNQLGQSVCGGTIIDNLHILTASHCFFTENVGTGTFTKAKANELIVFSGSSTMPFDGENPAGLVRRYVTEIFTHENYNPWTYENDIAILKLRAAIVFDVCHKPMCMVNGSITPQQATSCRTMGWGKTSNAVGATASTFLQYVDVPVSSDSACRSIYGSLSSDRTFCAGSVGKDSCKGDSGSPLACKAADGRYYGYGVVSAGVDSNCGNYLGIYTKVSAFLPWIDSIRNRLA